MATHRELSDEQIEELVAGVVAGGPQTLEQAVHEALWPEGAPEVWGDWPREAMRVWSRCVDVYVRRALRRDGGQSSKGWSRNTTTLEDSWAAVLQAAAEPRTWWKLKSWEDLARGLNLTRRVAAYRLESLGWRFSDAGLTTPRPLGGLMPRVIVAPCLGCGRPVPPHRIATRERLGPCCRS